MKKIMCLTALALSVSFSQVAPVFAHGMCWDHGVRIEKMAKKLDLNAEQRTKINSIRMESKQKLHALDEEMRMVRGKIDEAFKTDSLNAMKQRMFVNEEKNIMGSILKVRMEERVAMGQVLNATQKAKLIEMKEQFKAERKAMHKGMHKSMHKKEASAQ